MSLARVLPSTYVPDRLSMCRCGCGAPVPKTRKLYATRECAHVYALRTNAGYQRKVVLERDKGRCANCGSETLTEQARRGLDGYNLRRYRIPRWARGAWEMDHILPVVEGGGVRAGATAAEILANLRTLCLRCHKAETAALAARRAAARRSAQAPAVNPQTAFPMFNPVDKQ